MGLNSNLSRSPQFGSMTEAVFVKKHSEYCYSLCVRKTTVRFEEQGIPQDHHASGLVRSRVLSSLGNRTDVIVCTAAGANRPKNRDFGRAVGRFNFAAARFEGKAAIAL